jgi:hypothetical protein
MKRSMATTLWRFSTTRMLHEYTERLYLPAAGIAVPDAGVGPGTDVAPDDTAAAEDAGVTEAGPA